MKKQPKAAKLTNREITANEIQKEMRKLKREYDREYNPLAAEVRDANEAILNRLHDLLFDGLFVEGPYGFTIEVVSGRSRPRKATDAECRRALINDHGVEIPIALYGDIPAQVVAALRARVKLHQAAIRRIVAAGKRGELVAVRPPRKPVKR